HARRPPTSTLFPYHDALPISYGSEDAPADTPLRVFHVGAPPPVRKRSPVRTPSQPQSHPGRVLLQPVTPGGDPAQSTIAAAQPKDRKSTRLNSSHVKNSYAVF